MSNGKTQQKWPFLTKCEKMHSKKNYPESDMHVACVQKKLSNLDQPFLTNRIFSEKNQ